MARDPDAMAEAHAYAPPGYPPAIVELLTAHVGVRPGDRVAEIGAGTGLFTALLAERGFALTALEPSAAMRSRAPFLPGVTWGSGTFEDTSLPSGSQRWVVAAQSFHWARPERALGEIRRVLEPGAWFTALWNAVLPERERVIAWTLTAMRRHIPEYRFPYRATPARRAAARVMSSLPAVGQRAMNSALRLLLGGRGASRAGLVLSTSEFERAVYHEVEHRVPMSRARYIELWSSYQRLSSVARPAARDAFLGELSNHLARLEVHAVEVPYVCAAWSARARG